MRELGFLICMIEALFLIVTRCGTCRANTVCKSFSQTNYICCRLPFVHSHLTYDDRYGFSPAFNTLNCRMVRLLKRCLVIGLYKLKFPRNKNGINQCSITFINYSCSLLFLNRNRMKNIFHKFDIYCR